MHVEQYATTQCCLPARLQKFDSAGSDEACAQAVEQRELDVFVWSLYNCTTVDLYVAPDIHLPGDPFYLQLLQACHHVQEAHSPSVLYSADCNLDCLHQTNWV